MTVKCYESTYKNCYPIIGRYHFGNALCVEIVNDSDGNIGRMTVNLSDPHLKSDEGYVDTNNWPDVLDIIREYKLGNETGVWRQSGFCKYPLIRFDIKRLEYISKMRGAI